MNPLNRILNPNPDPVYYTPPVIAQQVIHNQTGANVTIINPPFASDRPKRKNWKRSFRIFKHLYITFSNGRVKNRNTPSDHPRTHAQAYQCRERKGKLYERQQGICPECGQHFAINQMEYHHILPWARFPELRGSIRNAVMLCHNCHKEVHCNPWRNIAMMKKKAEELGIDLKERYDYGKEDVHDCEG